MTSSVTGIQTAELMSFLGGQASSNQRNQGPSFRLATIPNGYAGGRPTLMFDGETVATARTYPYLSTYVPAAGDRVLVAMLGYGGVVLGRIV